MTEYSKRNAGVARKDVISIPRPYPATYGICVPILLAVCTYAGSSRGNEDVIALGRTPSTEPRASTAQYAVTAVRPRLTFWANSARICTCARTYGGDGRR